MVNRGVSGRCATADKHKNIQQGGGSMMVWGDFDVSGSGYFIIDVRKSLRKMLNLKFPTSSSEDQQQVSPEGMLSCMLYDLKHTWSSSSSNSTDLIMTVMKPCRTVWPQDQGSKSKPGQRDLIKATSINPPIFVDEGLQRISLWPESAAFSRSASSGRSGAQDFLEGVGVNIHVLLHFQLEICITRPPCTCWTPVCCGRDGDQEFLRWETGSLQRHALITLISSLTVRLGQC